MLTTAEIAQCSLDTALIGKRIKKARKEKRQTQEYLAGLCDCTPTHICNIENGKIGISLELLFKISVSARELSEQLWPDKEYDNPTGNIRTLLYRFWSAFRLVSDTDLIVTTPNGYRINTNLKIETDFEKFEQGCHMAKKMQGKQEKIDTLKEIVKLYRGKMFLTGSAEHWQIAYISKFHLMYLAAIEMLMELLYEKQAYGVMHEYATRAISVEPDNPSIIYWLIVALRKYGAADMAKEHLESAKIRLLAEEYHELEG